MLVKKIFLAYIIGLILLTGCASREYLTSTKTNQKIKSEAQTKIQNISDIETWQQTDNIDLDGDEIKDKILFKCQPGSNDFTLKVNNVSTSGKGENLDGNFVIVNIDKTDKFNEIAISESGPSSDEQTAFYCYDGQELIFMGKVQGSNNSIKILGDGKVIANKRGQILQTWFYEEPYNLSKLHKLEKIPQDLYKMNSKVKMKKELRLLQSRTDKNFSITLQKGEEVIILLSDDKHWCLVENSKGKKGWFALDNYDQIRGTNWKASEVFEGLCYAD